MDLKTKYDTEQKLFFFHENRIIQRVIQGIEIQVAINGEYNPFDKNLFFISKWNREKVEEVKIKEGQPRAKGQIFYLFTQDEYEYCPNFIGDIFNRKDSKLLIRVEEERVFETKQELLDYIMKENA